MGIQDRVEYWMDLVAYDTAQAMLTTGPTSMSASWLIRSSKRE